MWHGYRWWLLLPFHIFIELQQQNWNHHSYCGKEINCHCPSKVRFVYNRSWNNRSDKVSVKQKYTANIYAIFVIQNGLIFPTSIWRIGLLNVSFKHEYMFGKIECSVCQFIMFYTSSKVSDSEIICHNKHGNLWTHCCGLT